MLLLAMFAAALPAAAAAVPPVAMPLTVLDAGAATAAGAVCLDGSPPGLYFRAAPGAASATSWVIYLQGGAWCTSVADCAGRAKGHLGSSAFFPPKLGYGGVLDPDPVANPTFARFNHVIVPVRRAPTTLPVPLAELD